VPITPYNGTAVQNVSIGLINCQSICNKSDEISDVIKDMDLDGLVITDTWRCDSSWIFIPPCISDSQERWGVGIFLRDSLKCETNLHFKARSFENYQLTFVSVGDKCSCSYYLPITPH